MVKAFSEESHEKDVERLPADRRCETESKEAHALAHDPKHTVLSMTGLTSSVDYHHVSDGERGILSVHETNQTESWTVCDISDRHASCTVSGCGFRPLIASVLIH